MAEIRVLEKQVSELIAAGEVIDRRNQKRWRNLYPCVG